jgi:hypothetical protein
MSLLLRIPLTPSMNWEARKNYRTLRITAVTLPRISQSFPSMGAKLSLAGSSQIWPFLRENVLTVASPSIMAANIGES